MIIILKDANSMLSEVDVEDDCSPSINALWASALTFIDVSIK